MAQTPRKTQADWAKQFDRQSAAPAPVETTEPVSAWRWLVPLLALVVLALFALGTGLVKLPF